MRKDCFVFLDIDGTIYTRTGGVPESTREAIDKLRKNGHHPVLCTGRAQSILLPEVKTLPVEGKITGVGARGEWNGEVLFHELLPQEEIGRILENFVRFGFAPYAEGPFHMYYAPEIARDPERDLEQIFSISDTTVLKPFSYGDKVEASKVSALFLEGSDKKGFEKALGNQYFGINHHNVLLETFSSSLTKGHGIRKLLSAIHAEDAETFGYGDSFNDLEMLQTVKHGVCMGNADPKLLARIPLHTKPINEDGLYLSLKEFGLI